VTARAGSRPALVLLAVGGVWGASFLFIKVALEEISPIEVVAARLVFGALALLPVVAFRGTPLRRSPQLLARVSAVALLSNVAPFTLIAWAEVHIESGVASVLNSTMPLFTGLFAAAFLAEEQLSPGRLAGLITGFVGVVVLGGIDILAVRESALLGQLAVVAAAACYGAGGVFARTLLRTEDPLSLSALQVTLGAVFAIPIALAWAGTPDYSLSVKAWLSLAALGTLGTGLAFVGYLWLVDNTGSVRASLVTYIIPAVGLLLGWAVLDERIGLNTLLGAALIAVGVASVLRGQAPSSQRAQQAPAGAG